MALVERFSNAARAMVASNAQKFLDRQHATFPGVMNGAYKQGIVTPDEMAEQFNVQTQHASRWSKDFGNLPAPATQREIVKFVLSKYEELKAESI